MKFSPGTLSIIRGMSMKFLDILQLRLTGWCSCCFLSSSGVVTPDLLGEIDFQSVVVAEKEERRPLECALAEAADLM
jgi:hypothetical protein